MSGVTQGAARASDRGEAAHAEQRRGTRQLLVSRAFFLGANYVTAVIVARALGPAEYGVYGVVLTFLFWLEMVTSAGIPGATTKLMPEAARDDAAIDGAGVEGTARFLLLAIGLAAFGIGWIAAPGIDRLFQIPDGDTLFRIAILDLPLAAMYAAYQGILGGRSRFRALATAQVVLGGARLLGVAVLAAVGMSVAGVLVVNAVGTAVAWFYLARRYPPTDFRPRRDVLQRIAAIAPATALYMIGAQVLVNLDLWAFKSLWTGDADVVGQYAAAASIGKMLIVIPAVQSAVLFASVAWALNAGDELGARRHIHEATRFALLIAAPAWALVAVEGPAVMGVLFSEAFVGGGRYLPFQLLAFALFGLLDAFSHCLVAAGRPWLAAGTPLAVVPLVWLSNAVLIPRLGAVGAAASLVGGMALATLASGVLAYRRFGPLFPLATVGRVVGAAAIVGTLNWAWNVPGAWVLAKLVILGLGYLLLLAWFRELAASDFAIAGRREQGRRAG